MILATLLIVAIVLLVVGAPIYVFLGLPGATALALYTGLPWEAIGARVFDQVTSDTLAAIPMFILLGNLMTATSGARYLIEFMDTLVRQLSGGLALVAIMAAIFFAGVTGSSVGEAAILASALGPPMTAAGYGPRFTAGVLAGGATLGILIPPSVPMLLYSAVTGESTGDLFIAGVLPGLFVGGLLFVSVMVWSKWAGFGGAPAASWAERRRAFVRAGPMLAIPIVIVASLYSGFATATETGAVACGIGLLAALAYRELTLPMLVRVLVATARTSGMLLIVIATSAIFSFILIYGRAPQYVTQAIADLHLNSVGFLLAVGALLLVLGVILDPPPMIFITLPIIYPILATLGISPVHFAVIMMVTLQIAQISPPVGMSLYATSSLAHISIEDVFAGVIPFMGILVIALLVIMFVPWLSLALVP
jgi:C4-dicarboxylate transporter DctM subunit